jgi:DNA helicase-2/ATP-dependent DNA helicase PcrA
MAKLLETKPTLQRILADRHPVILIDESQDTMRGVLDALLKVAETPNNPPCLGLLGDHRQRVYLDGHRDLPTAIPEAWKRPALQMNHRSAKRIVRLINRIWDADLTGRTQSKTGGAQSPRTDRVDGTVRLFIGDAKTETAEKITRELGCAAKMSELTGDSAWADHVSGYQTLTLEHKLAAIRLGFFGLATAIQAADKERIWERPEADDGSDGGPSALRVFMGPLAALSKAVRPDNTLDGFAAMELLRHEGRLDVLVGLDAVAQAAELARLDATVKALVACFEGAPTLRDLLRVVVAHDLFRVHHALKTALDEGAEQAEGNAVASEAEEDPDDAPAEGAWQAVLNRPWSELMSYRAYLNRQRPYATHQGVKGDEFHRVQVILDDVAAGGSQFAYDKVFGAKKLTATDQTNVETGNETSVDRTLRLLYVTCSRAKDSLAIVYWSADPVAAMVAIKKADWFDADEVIDMAAV